MYCSCPNTSVQIRHNKHNYYSFKKSFSPNLILLLNLSLQINRTNNVCIMSQNKIQPVVHLLYLVKNRDPARINVIRLSIQDDKSMHGDKNKIGACTRTGTSYTWTHVITHAHTQLHMCTHTHTDIHACIPLICIIMGI